MYNGLYEARRIMPVPDQLFSTVYLVELVVYALTLISYVMLVYAIRRPTSTLGSYKYYIILNATLSLMYSTFVTLFHPEAILPYPTLILHGLSDVYIDYIGQMVSNVDRASGVNN